MTQRYINVPELNYDKTKNMNYFVINDKGVETLGPNVRDGDVFNINVFKSKKFQYRIQKTLNSLKRMDYNEAVEVCTNSGYTSDKGEIFIAYNHLSFY